MLKIEQVSFSYGSIRTLREVDMVMQPGEVTCIVGRNGCITMSTSRSVLMDP
jgi:ABC-type branched-subunit amino acid transport system ATPase component